MKKKTTYLAALSLVLVLSASVSSAWAYFTTNASARGGYRLRLGNVTEITEEFDSWTKHVTVTNDAASGPVYIRVRAFAGSEYALIYDGAGWTPGTDGYYYYDEIVAPGEGTGVLDIRITGVPEGITEAEEFNVAVVYESTPVQYDENGDPYADWNITLDTGDVEGGAA